MANASALQLAAIIASPMIHSQLTCVRCISLVYPTNALTTAPRYSLDMKAIDDTVAQAICELDDSAVMYGLTIINIRPKSTTFDPFWDKSGTYIEELIPAVDETLLG